MASIIQSHEKTRFEGRPRVLTKRQEYILTAKIWFINLAIFATLIWLGAMGF